jgi:hypothetical protein
MSMRIRSAFAVLLFSIFVNTSSAATFSIGAGGLDLQVVSSILDASIQEYDIRGVAGINVTEGSFTGTFIVGDGTNLGGSPPPVPNHILIASNVAADEALLLFFGNPRVGLPGFLLDTASLGPLSPSITDPILVYLANNQTTFGFTLTGTTPLNDSQLLSTWVLSSITGPDMQVGPAVPEPGSVVLVLSGAAIVMARRRRVGHWF